MAVLAAGCGTTRTPDQWALSACNHLDRINGITLTVKERKAEVRSAVHAADKAAVAAEWQPLRDAIHDVSVKEQQNGYQPRGVGQLIGAQRAGVVISACSRAGQPP